MPNADGPLILAVDQGTSATKAILVDAAGAVVSKSTVPVSQAHPRPGWTEQDPREIWASVSDAIAQCVESHDQTQIAAIGLSTQRESTLLWDRASGDPVGPMLGWQDQRGAAICDALRSDGHAERIRAISGLPLDAMFSASKAAWLLDRYDPDRALSASGRLLVGTMDCWLLWCLAGGEPQTRPHLIEVGNASRTMLLDLTSRAWDPWLLDRFDIPAAALPEIVGSAGPFPAARAAFSDGREIPIGGVLGDSHSALFAHAGWQPGRVKATYGTGSSVMGIVTDATADSPHLARTIAWQTDRPYYALEGNIRSTGATLAWLATVFGTTPAALADQAGDSSDGVTLVPAFTGLGAPWWDDAATGLISGLSFGTGPPQLARAAVESIAFQVEDVVAEVERVVGRIDVLLADGGATGNPTLMQLQADTSGRAVQRALDRDLSALGVAHLAGHTVGVWSDAELEALPRERQTYASRLTPAARETALAHWHDEVARSRMITVAAIPGVAPDRGADRAVLSHQEGQA